MKYLDTNVFVRFFINDDPKQSAKVKKLFLEADDNSLGLLLTVIIESEWVLRSVYDFKKEEIIELFNDALMLNQIKIENAVVLHRALNLYKKGNANFADAIHAAQAFDHGKTILSFDKNAESVGMVLIK